MQALSCQWSVASSRGAAPVRRSLRRAAAFTVRATTDAEAVVDVQPTSVRDVTKGRIVVLGGAAAAQGFAVTSLSRSGAPASPILGVDYQRGDVFSSPADSPLLAGASAVVSCIGGFGTNEEMERINGDANVAAVTAAKAAGVPRFVYVSVYQYNLPSFVTDAIGYFVGKRKAEKAVLAAYGDAATVLQPGFIYGDRAVGTATLPLGTVGKPLEQLLTGSLGKALKPLGAIPGSDILLAPPVSVDAVATAAVRCATGSAPAGVYDIDSIVRIASA